MEIVEPHEGSVFIRCLSSFYALTLPRRVDADFYNRKWKEVRAACSKNVFNINHTVS